MTTTTRLAINTQPFCEGSDDCYTFAANLANQLSTGGYNPASVLELPDQIDTWLAQHRTARKRVLRAQRLGYTFDTIDREQHEADINEINTSAPVRQGKPMTRGYRDWQTFGPLEAFPCPLHAIRAYGVTLDTPKPGNAPERVNTSDRLVAYLVVHRAGELAVVSQILGHADNLKDGIMYLLVAGMLSAERLAGPGYAWYNRHDSGTSGLVWFKERCGFTTTDCEYNMSDPINPIEVVEVKNWLANLGEMSWTFFKELTDQGFSRREALTLTTAWLAEITRSGKGDGQ